jgi:hypothetical protein
VIHKQAEQELCAVKRGAVHLNDIIVTDKYIQRASLAPIARDTINLTVQNDFNTSLMFNH